MKLMSISWRKCILEWNGMNDQIVICNKTKIIFLLEWMIIPHFKLKELSVFEFRMNDQNVLFHKHVLLNIFNCIIDYKWNSFVLVARNGINDQMFLSYS